MRKLEKRWIISFLLITIVAIAGLFWPESHTNTVLSGQFGTTDQINGADVAWLLGASSMVLFMTPGLSFFYGGMVGKKNVISTMLQSFICLGVVTLLWVVVGFSLSFGDPIGITINGKLYSFLGDPTSFAFMDNVGVLPHKIMAPTVPPNTINTDAVSQNEANEPPLMMTEVAIMISARSNPIMEARSITTASAGNYFIARLGNKCFCRW